jgi:hypothetical protein
LGSKRFKELQLMKFVWHNNIEDLAVWNSAQVEEINIEEFEELLAADLYADELNTPEDELILLD